MNKVLVTSEEHRPNSHIIQLLKDALNYLPASIIPAILGVITSAIFTRAIPVSEYGIFSLILAIMAPIGTVLTEWIGQPVGRFYAEYKQTDRLKIYLQTVTLLSYFTAIVVIVFSVLAAIGIFVIKHDLPYPMLLLGASFGLLVQSLFSFSVRILPAGLQISAYRTAIVVPYILSSALSITLIFVIRADIMWLVWSPAIATAIILPYIYHKAGISLHIQRPLLNARIIHTLRRFWRYGGPMMIWVFSAGLLDMCDRYIIQYYLGSSAVGIYSVNYSLVSQAFGLISGPFFAAAIPIIMIQWARRETALLQTTISQLTDAFLILGFLMLSIVGAVGQPLLHILVGPDFWAGYVILLPVLAGKIIWGASMLGHKSIEFTEKTYIMVVYSLISALINLILNLILVKRYGYIAAAYTTLLCYSIYTCLVWRYSRRVVPWSISLKNVFISGISAMFSYIIFEILIRNITYSDITVLILGLCVVPASYTAVIFIFRHRDMRRYYAQYVSRKIA